MSNRVTVIVYHYVRDLKNSRYPDIKGLDIESFKSQINYLETHYTFVTIEEVIHSIDSGEPLPPQAVLLTFNDSYLDHFQNVFPILDAKGIQGCFYPEIAAIKENKVLINHKIHFILAAAPSSSVIKEQIFSHLEELSNSFDLHDNTYYYDKLAEPSTYDTKETVFVKRILQSGLPNEASEIIATRLFDEFVGVSEETFSKELYLNEKQVKCMIRHGMHFGILGYHHRRYEDLEFEEQKKEISKVVQYLTSIGINNNSLTASYPWGSYNEDTLKILNHYNCKAAFTARTGVANLEEDPILELPRLDTNEIPKKEQKTPNHWFAKA